MSQILFSIYIPLPENFKHVPENKLVAAGPYRMRHWGAYCGQKIAGTLTLIYTHATELKIQDWTIIIIIIDNSCDY